MSCQDNKLHVFFAAWCHARSVHSTRSQRLGLIPGASLARRGGTFGASYIQVRVLRSRSISRTDGETVASWSSGQAATVSQGPAQVGR